MSRLKIVIWILLALITVSGSAAGGPPLAEVPAQLQAGGLQIVFSSAVVSPAMVVENESDGDQPRGDV